MSDLEAMTQLQEENKELRRRLCEREGFIRTLHRQMAELRAQLERQKERVAPQRLAGLDEY